MQLGSAMHEFFKLDLEFRVVSTYCIQNQNKLLLYHFEMLLALHCNELDIKIKKEISCKFESSRSF